MTPIERLMDRLDETQRRFDQRADTRDRVTESLSRGDYVAANENDALRARLSQLGMRPELTEQIGTRSFHLPERAATESPRAIIDNVTLERILGKNDLMPISFLLLGQHRARSVGRIHIRDRMGRRLGFGTGFLVSPQLLLTNNHVLERAEEAAFSEVEFDFEVDFAGNLRTSVSFKLRPDDFFVTDVKLDFSLVAVAPNAELGREPREWGWNRLLEQDGLVVKGESVTVIQHPNGEAKQIALRENRVIDLLDNFTHYQTDTAPGSSGSPVFNDQWEVVALHHSGVPERDGDGKIVAVDGRTWTPSMGDHRIKWIANEGVSVTRLAAFIKGLSDLSTTAKGLRDDLFTAEPPLPEAVQLVSKAPTTTDDAVSPAAAQANKSVGIMTVSAMPTATEAVWTIPLQVSIRLGMPQFDMPSGTIAGKTPHAAVPFQAADNAELQSALAELDRAPTRTYFDADKDVQDRDQYYASIESGELNAEEMFQQLGKLLKTTHAHTPRYSPSTEVYPWIDLHPDRKLRSIYSGKLFEAEELIREDFRIGQQRVQRLQELMQRESGVTPERLQEEVDLLEAANPFNCEHVVPQSWFNKKEPMRGDLHHLFACESGCNSFRSNIPYFDFSDFEEAVRSECGKRVENKFEPSSGRGAVARATLYFLLRYPGRVDDPDEFPADRITTLLNWHGDNPVSEYERHRNQAIFEKQGNRNPLIDHPDWAGKIRFSLGLSNDAAGFPSR